MTSSNGNIFGVTGPLWGESTGHRWIPLTKASDTVLWCFLWSAWTNDWATTRDVGDLRRHRAHYDVTVMCLLFQAVVSLTLFVLYAPLFSSVGHVEVELAPGDVHRGCSSSTGNPDLLPYTSQFYPYMDLVMSCLFPFTLILGQNIAIAVRLCGRVNNATSSSQTTAIAMLQAVSIAFLVLTIPFPVYFICGRLSDAGYNINLHDVLMAGAISAVCDTINHSINIFLYSICGQNFRMVTARVITCGIYGQNKTAPQKYISNTNSTTVTTVTHEKMWNTDAKGGVKDK